MQITKNFSLKELTRSEMARRSGIDNTPSEAELENIKYTAEQLEKVREYVGRAIIVTSCFRNERVNKLVGGVPTSAHRFGLAADCDAVGLTSLAFGKLILKMRDEEKIKFDQLILEYPERGDGAWIHLGFRRNAPMRNQVFTLTRVKGKLVRIDGLRV